jgi:hypothetical protein
MMLNFFKDKNGNLNIIQAPNPPLIGWIVFFIAARLVTAGTFKSGLEFLSAAALVTWAYLEITAGESPFRRILGSLVMLAVIITHLR